MNLAAASPNEAAVSVTRARRPPEATDDVTIVGGTVQWTAMNLRPRSAASSTAVWTFSTIVRGSPSAP